MIPVKCRKCGHVQDAGSALNANDICERCGNPIYGPATQDPAHMAGLAIVTLIGAYLLGFPWEFLIILIILTVILIINALVRRVH